jgi:SAM-dependent methyltransferase
MVLMSSASYIMESLVIESGQYNNTARHFDIDVLPKLLRKSLPFQRVALADFGCGDGPLFAALARDGFISPEKAVYAVDLDAERLSRVRARFPYIDEVIASADEVAQIPTGSLDFVISTMVMEHVVDDQKYLREIHRVLRTGGRAYITTVFKRRWAWYFRKRNGESVLDTTHLREYTDLAQFIELFGAKFRKLVALEMDQMWFPLLDPILFRIGALNRHVLRILRGVKVPIPGYFTISVVVER